MTLVWFHISTLPPSFPPFSSLPQLALLFKKETILARNGGQRPHLPDSGQPAPQSEGLCGQVGRPLQACQRARVRRFTRGGQGSLRSAGAARHSSSSEQAGQLVSCSYPPLLSLPLHLDPFSPSIFSASPSSMHSGSRSWLASLTCCPLFQDAHGCQCTLVCIHWVH